MNSASMATNLLGMRVRLKERPVGCSSDEGLITLVSIDSDGVHFLILIGSQLVRVDSVDQFTVIG